MSIHFIPLGSGGGAYPEGCRPLRFTIGVLQTAIRSVEHPWERILIVRLYPSVPAISGEKRLFLR
jgi:hypothetical protein